MATTDKYDRQLRLWGANGQRKLMKAHILCIGAGAAAAETLKNLVLPAIGRFTILDDKVVQPEDLGNNFFFEVTDLNKPRAEVLKNMLCELNPDVQGFVRVANLGNLLDKEPEFFRSFSLIIACNLAPNSLTALSKVLSSSDHPCPPLIALRAYGLIGSVRLQSTRTHYVIDSKTDSELLQDLRLTHLFPALCKYCEEFDLASMNSADHSHVPYIVLLYQARQRLARELGRDITSKDIGLIRTTLTGMRMHADEDNFQEALKEAHRLFRSPRITDELAETISSLRDRNFPPSASDSPHVFLCWALGQFLDQYGIPPLSSLPDMHSSSDNFLRLQDIFKHKAQEEFDIYVGFLHQLLQNAGLPIDSIHNEEIEIFVRRASDATAFSTSSIADETALRSPDLGDSVRDTLTMDRYSDPLQTPMIWYLCLRAADEFYVKNARYPGDSSAPLATDENQVFDILRNLCTSLGVPEELIEGSGATKMDTEEQEPQLISRAHAQEIVRFGACELHTIAAIVGGIASQEAVKLLTNQFVPINNTYIFNGIASVGGTYRL